MENLDKFLWVIYGMSVIPAIMLAITLTRKTIPGILKLVSTDTVDTFKRYFLGVKNMLFKPLQKVV